MIKVFTTNKNGKIELTKEELKALLDEAYWDGYKANCTTYTYTTPSWTPYSWTASNGVINCVKNDSATISTADYVSNHTTTTNKVEVHA